MRRRWEVSKSTFEEVYGSLEKASQMGKEGTWPIRMESVKKLMEKKPISVTDLARAVGITRKGLNNILKGESKPYERTLIRIAAALGIRNWRSLVEGSTEEPKKRHGGDGVETQTTVDVLVETTDDFTTEELYRRLGIAFKKAGKQIEAAQIIRIVKVRTSDEI